MAWQTKDPCLSEQAVFSLTRDPAFQFNLSLYAKPGGKLTGPVYLSASGKRQFPVRKTRCHKGKSFKQISISLVSVKYSRRKYIFLFRLIFSQSHSRTRII